MKSIAKQIRLNIRRLLKLDNLDKFDRLIKSYERDNLVIRQSGGRFEKFDRRIYRLQFTADRSKPVVISFSLTISPDGQMELFDNSRIEMKTRDFDDVAFVVDSLCSLALKGFLR